MASTMSSMCSVAGDQALGPLQAQRAAQSSRKALRVDGGVFLERFVLGHGVADDLVVHVGDVHDVVEAEAAGAQPVAQDVDESEGAEVADVGEIVDRGAAGVHADGVVARRVRTPPPAGTTCCRSAAP